MPYAVSFKDILHDEEQEALQAIVRWAGDVAHRYQIEIEPDKYPQSRQIDQLKGLFGEFFPGRYPDTVQLRGDLSPDMIPWLLQTPVPATVISGDSVPVLDLNLLRDDRSLLRVQDYGRTYTLDLHPDEHTALITHLKPFSDFSERIVPYSDEPAPLP